MKGDEIKSSQEEACVYHLDL